jgi:hypothetical protein
MSNKSTLLKNLEKNKGKVAFTVPQAEARFNMSRVPARIFDLRQEGYDIASVDRTTAWGTHTVGYGLNLRSKAAKRY